MILFQKHFRCYPANGFLYQKMIFAFLSIKAMVTTQMQKSYPTLKDPDKKFGEL